MSDRKKTGTTSWDAEQVRRETSQKPAEKKERKKKKVRLGWLWYILGVLVASALLAGIGWLMVNDVCALNKEPLTATVEVTRGDSVSVVTPHRTQTLNHQTFWWQHLKFPVSEKHLHHYSARMS